LAATTGVLRCRSCRAPLTTTFIDLGEMPLANSYLTESDLDRAEPRYPLHVRVCDQCLLVQAADVVDPRDIFSDYAYFSSYSDAWVEHARRFAAMAIPRFGLGPDSLVMEVASNDGYLLRHFIERGVRVLGIEPAENVAEVARAAGVPTETEFFGIEVAEKLRAGGTEADLLVANNVLAHVPDYRDFVEGLSIAVAPEGVVSVEFPHLLRLVENVEFDTIYHEHHSYLALVSVECALEAHGLRVFDVEELPTHGGSLRVLACRRTSSRPEEAEVARVRAKEAAGALDDVATYEEFGRRVREAQRSLRENLDRARANGEIVVAYGAAAKGNTLLNSCGVTGEDIAYVVDRSPHKHGLYMPGSRLPIRPPEAVRETKPDILLVLAWNHLDEIRQQMGFVTGWGCRFAVAIPSFTFVP